MSVDYSKENKYEILGVKEYATNSEITEQYNKLKSKLSEDRFLPGDAGNYAAERLEAVENAYQDIMSERKSIGMDTEKDFSYAATVKREYVGAGPEKKAEKQEEEPKEESNKTDYSKVDKLIKEGKIDEAQRALDEFGERLAEWHYLQAVIYYKKNWVNECKKQMEIALTKDPKNPKYKESYDKLCKEMEYKSKNFSSDNAQEERKNEPHKDFDPYEKQMGGNECLNSCCQCVACNMLLNCCCNCCR